MKTIVISFLFALLIPFWGIAQSKSSITIKTITIENGDTIVKERHYNSEGNGITFDDTIFNKNDRFIFFNNDYDLDTNFSEEFHEIFRHEMNDFFRNFNNAPFDLGNEDFDIYHRALPLDLDSALTNHDLYKLIPRDTAYKLPEKKYFNPEIPENNNISTKNIIIPSRQPVEGFSVTPASDDENLKIVFNLDPKNSSQWFLKNENQKVIYKEKLPKSGGVYTRLLDCRVYSPGTYYIEVRQGKKSSAIRITHKF